MKSADINIIIPSYQPGTRLGRCLESVLGCSERDFEIWLVDSSPGPIEPLIEGFKDDPRLHPVRSETRLFPGAARDLGVGLSKGKVIVFIDCDCIASPGWLDLLVEELETSGYAACGGGVENGTPESYFGTAEYLCESSGFTPRSPSRDERFLPSCNMAMNRDVYLAAGGFSGEMLAGEDVALGKQLIRMGKDIRFLPEAYVTHYNRTRARDFPRDQFRLGKGAAVNFLSGNQPYSSWRESRLKTAALALGAGPIRLARVMSRVLAQHEVSYTRLAALSPAMVLGAAAFGAGFLSIAMRPRQHP
jgi:GT2 family glycosyltransferase